MAKQLSQKASKATGRRGLKKSKGQRIRRSGPGRPEGISNIRDDILDAAEALFAELGYAGATLRAVAERAQVTQALISYYFGGKYGLFEQVFLRHSRKISDERVQRLEALRASKRPPEVGDIVRAFLLPTLALRATPEGRSFLRLQARLHTEPPEISYKLRREAYDASTRAYAAAFREALPHLSERDVYWRVALMVGAYLYAVSDTHRLEELSGDLCNPDDTEELLAALAAFVTGGMQAPPDKG